MLRRVHMLVWLTLVVLFSTPALLAVGGPVTVLAASSLTDPFKEIGELYSKKFGGEPLSLNFGASNELRMQLEHGASADVFAPASTKEMDKADASGLVGPAAVFASNGLTVVLPASNPGKVLTLEELGKPGLKVVLAHPNVPAGGYALEALDKLGADFGPDFKKRVLANLVSQETNVKQVMAKILLGEADAGIVYRSDVTPRTADKVRVLEIPEKSNVVAAYPIAAVVKAKQAGGARKFIDLVLSADGQAILRKYGFSEAAK